MRRGERAALRKQYDLQCGYCGVRETDAGAALTIDHFQPQSKGGSQTLDNLVYCCHACNEFKGDYWQPDSVERILHPQRDDLREHIAEDENGLLRGLSQTGSFHIRHLKLNRPALVSYRRERRLLAAEREQQARMAERLLRLERQINHLTKQVERLKGEE